MTETMAMTARDGDRLRSLAERMAGYAALPVMAERARLWRAHNALAAPRPLVVIEMDTFEAEMLPPLECAGVWAREVERDLLRSIVHHERIDDDVVVPDFLAVQPAVSARHFGIEVRKVHATDGQGRDIGFAFQHPVTDLDRDLPRLGKSVFAHDRAATEARLAFARDAVGDILPARLCNGSLNWLGPSERVVELMGLEAMMMALAAEPDGIRALYDLIVDDLISFIRWQEAEGILTLNNGNHYAGAGSYGFTEELPAPGYDEARGARSRDLWGNINSQETVGVSPAMYLDLVLPSYKRLAGLFGLVYYGCCEPVHAIWKDGVGELPRLRKVSVSAWCDEPFMGDALRGSRVIYSRKPSPNFLGVGKVFDEEGFRAHIDATLRAARGCALEIINRDVYTLTGDPAKAARAVRVMREEIDRLWR
jgi:hypothetical protein